MRAAIGVLFLVLVGCCTYLWQRNQQLREQNALPLRKEKQATSELAALQVASAEENRTELDRLKQEASEVRALRSEVSVLREKSREAEQIAAQQQRLQVEIKRQGEKAPPGEPGKDYFSRDSWSFAGYGSPEAALISAIWAMKEGNPTTYLNSLSPEEQVRMAEVWKNKTEGEVASKHQNDVSAITGIRVLERQPVSEQEVQMRVVIDGVNRTEIVSMKLVGNEWKFAGFQRPPQ